jgi:hypothetical protein
MFILTVHDRNGVELKEGDLVKISNGREFAFYSGVKWLEKEKALAPFDTFTFHSFEKVDSIPENAEKSTNESYNIWFALSDNTEYDGKADEFENYLMSWRRIDVAVKNRSYQIKKIED